MFHTVTLSFKDQKMSMMNQAIYYGSGHLIIREDTALFGELKVGGQDQALALIAV